MTTITLNTESLFKDILAAFDTMNRETPLNRFLVDLGRHQTLVLKEMIEGQLPHLMEEQSKEVKKLEELNKEMLEGLKVAESEIRCQQLEADFNYARCHGLPTPKIDEMEKEEKWCDEVYMLRELIKRVEGENQ